MPLESAAMQRPLDGDQAAMRQRVRDILCRPQFRYYTGTDIQEYRDLVYCWCRDLAAEGLGALAMPVEYGGQDDFAGFMAAFETIAFHDISLTIKFTVQFGLWQGSVLLLGTEAHHRNYLRAIGTLALPGCFAMTEIGHGSNVRDLETLAVYDPAEDCFVVHSPTFTAGKNYIGNAGCHGQAATVFAQLEVGGTRHGVHAWVVPIRDGAGNVMPGVRIEDNGLKMGENGVDNARIWFDHVRVPREAFLDRFGGVDAAGHYASPIANPWGRFFAMLSALVGGRISIAAAGLSVAKSGLAIAVRYAARRRQFRAAGAQEETVLLDYPIHRHRLLPLLANAYALDFALKHLVQRRVEIGAQGEGEGLRELEMLAAAFKTYITWNTTRTLQACREACGGEGYMTINRLPTLKADSDIFTTFEGDNTVLSLWLGKQLVHGAARGGACPPGVPLWEAGQGWMPLFAYREQAMVAEAGEGEAPQQIRLARVARAYTERLILECFARGIERCREQQVVSVLRQLYDLFAVTLVDENRGWYLENGCLTPAASRALPGRAAELCADLAADAVALVDAFGIPEPCLAAPIAL